jgi:precorrin-6Y C5,15-methyltransferase (decarboxylating)
MSQPIYVIGIGHEGSTGLSPEARSRIAQAEVLAGGRRVLGFFPEFMGETIHVGANVPEVVAQLKACRAKRTVVVATGDPLFYGIGTALVAAFDKDELVFLPHVSSVQLAFARIRETWHDASIISLHGRPLESLGPLLAGRAAKIAVLTDRHNDPATIGRFVARHGAADDYTLWVAEDLGGASERVTQWSVESVQGAEFSPLNVVVLLRTSQPMPADAGPLLGIPDDRFAHRESRRGMITKREVRLMALAYLGLRPGEVLWDVGAGSGSVAIEAARLSAQLRVYAIEQSEPDLQNIRANIQAFGLANVEPVLGTAPDVLGELPAPEAVFIGGSGGRLEAIVTSAVERLRPGGRLVLNCITLETLTQGWSLLTRLNLNPQCTSVQLAHSQPLANLHALEPAAPIFILHGSKP